LDQEFQLLNFRIRSGEGLFCIKDLAAVTFPDLETPSRLVKKAHLHRNLAFCSIQLRLQQPDDGVSFGFSVGQLFVGSIKGRRGHGRRAVGVIALQ